MAATSKVILVTGDAVCEHSYFKGKRDTADSIESPGFRFEHNGGGALLLKDLIKRATTGRGGWKTEFGLDDDFKSLPAAYHAYCLWEKLPATDPDAKGAGKQKLVWRALQPPLGYGHPVPASGPAGAATGARAAVRKRKKPLRVAPEIVVIDDAGLGFRRTNCRALWPFRKAWRGRKAPRWVVLKMSGSVGGGDFWQQVVGNCPDNLVLIVSADQLRQRDVRIGRGLSWEATVEDVTAELQGNHLLAPLLRARHLIVTFGIDGAFWLDRSQESNVSRLVFDAEHSEGEWARSQGGGGMFGYMSCFTAAVVRQLCRRTEKPDIEQGLIAGLSACRELLELGYVPEPSRKKGRDGRPLSESCPRFPAAQVVARIAAPTHNFVCALVPQRLEARGTWMMLDEWQVNAREGDQPRPHIDLAAAVAVSGPGALGLMLPVATFGGLQTVDRGEIENLRTVRSLITAYAAKDAQNRPLSIGVFGPPGAGKSYGVVQIAKAVMHARDEDILTFNLSQFGDPAELNGAFHRVRDRALAGRTPLVFWDEFDSQGYKWLQYLLAPMQDGAFQDGEITHPIGRSIFVFAGATSPNYETFGPCDPGALEPSERNSLRDEPAQQADVERQWLEFVLKKGPDFKSRLSGYVNVLGPNPRLRLADASRRREWQDDPADRCCPIRRALFIRARFGLKDGERLELDPGVLRALLETPHYKAGSRSLEFLCRHLRDNGGNRPTRSHLPGRVLLDMHVDATAFWKLCERDLEFATVTEALARGLHDDWKGALNKNQKRTNTNFTPWNKLSKDARESTIAQAARIPSILALVGLQVVRGPALEPDDEERIREQLQSHAEILAEAEHNQWMVERMIAGWRYARISKKDTRLKLHPLLIPYAQLPKVERAKDLRVVKGQKTRRPAVKVPDYIDRVRRVGFRIEEIPPAT